MYGCVLCPHICVYQQLIKSSPSQLYREKVCIYLSANISPVNLIGTISKTLILTDFMLFLGLILSLFQQYLIHFTSFYLIFSCFRGYLDSFKLPRQGVTHQILCPSQHFLKIKAKTPVTLFQLHFQVAKNQCFETCFRPIFSGLLGYYSSILWLCMAVHYAQDHTHVWSIQLSVIGSMAMYGCV